jgi:hypothetical protein
MEELAESDVEWATAQKYRVTPKAKAACYPYTDSNNTKRRVVRQIRYLSSPIESTMRVKILWSFSAD